MKVILGGLELKTFEKPDSIQFGGKQQLAIREFPGGGQSIQKMGTTYRPVSWSGTFIGKDAYDRMMIIGLMRTAGKPVVLITDKFTMNVIIEEFYPDYKTDYRIPFSITLRRYLGNVNPSASKDPVDLVEANPIEGETPIKENIQEYVVQKGDTLSKIAGVVLKNPNSWEQIYNDNTDVLKKGLHNIQVGQVLKIKIT